MSAGKNPYLRYSIIDRCLGSKHKRYWTPVELLEKFAEYDVYVELRSLKYDLQNMRDNTQLKFNAPIGYSRANKSYYYTEEGYSIDGERLSHHDLMALTFVVNLLEQVEGATMLQQAKGAVSKLNKAKT